MTDSYYLYIISNNDWIYEKKFKYGFTTDPHNRILSEQHSYKSSYIKLYKIEELDHYNLIYQEYDKIISIIGRYYNIFKEKLENYHFHQI